MARSGRARRTRVSRDRYRSVARVSGVAPRLPKPLRALEIATVVLALVFVIAAAPRVAGLMGAGIAEFGTSVGELFPSAQGSKPIDLPTTGATVSTSLPLDNVPDFTREPAFKLSGKVPSFLIAPAEQIEVSLNGAVAATLTPDASGAYAATLALVEGPNPITIRLISGTDVLASSSYSVVLDRVAPGLVVTKPQPSESVDGPNVVVTGKAEAGTTIVVNDRVIVPGQDGSFNETYPAAAGPFTVTVLARDRAGNETTVKTAITVKAAATTAALVVGVTLDKLKVTPGQFVTADILVTASGAPRADEQVTLSVGVIPISSARTDAAGRARISFFAPPNEGDAAVVVLASGASGRATLTVAK